MVPPSGTGGDLSESVKLSSKSRDLQHIAHSLGQLRANDSKRDLAAKEAPGGLL